MSREQQAADCLVDGSKIAAARRAALEGIDVDAAIRDRIHRLDVAGESKWVERLAEANHGTDRLFDVAHYLYWLRRDVAVDAELRAVDELMYAIGCRFPASGPRPPGAPMVFGHPF